MPAFAALLCNTLTGLILLAAPSGERLARSVTLQVTFVALPLVNAVVLSAYVFGEDDYRHNGVSRWDAYRSPGGALGAMFVASVALMIACAALLAYACFRGRPRLFRPTALTGGLVAVFLVNATIAGFSVN